MQLVEGLWRVASGPQLSTGVWEAARVRVGSSSQQWRRLPALCGDDMMPWRRHLALQATFKHFKYHREVACVPGAALCPRSGNPRSGWERQVRLALYCCGHTNSDVPTWWCHAARPNTARVLQEPDGRWGKARQDGEVTALNYAFAPVRERLSKLSLE